MSAPMQNNQGSQAPWIDAAWARAARTDGAAWACLARIDGAAQSRLALIGVLIAVAGCRGEPPSPASGASSASPASSASAVSSTGGAAVAVPVDAEKVAAVMNPKHQAPYTGPTGTLRGHVRIKGDPPPDTPIQVPLGKCGEAAAAYGRLFRVGQDGALADALVTVVNYDGYVPEREEAQKLTIHGCALSRRTVAASFGQRIEVANLDPLESYMPYLDGAVTRAVLVAIPKGDAVRLYPREPGHYVIRDELPKPFMTADVFVLKFSTHAVTDLDGEFEIKNIPVGKVLTAAYLPAINEDDKKEIEIKAGDNTVDFQITFDLKNYQAAKDGEARGAEPAPTGAGSAAPAASTAAPAAKSAAPPKK